MLFANSLKIFFSTSKELFDLSVVIFFDVKNIFLTFVGIFFSISKELCLFSRKNIVTKGLKVYSRSNLTYKMLKRVLEVEKNLKERSKSILNFEKLTKRQKAY